MSLNDLFLFLNKIDVCNFVADTTPFVWHKNVAEFLDNFERDSELATHWFQDYYMKLNTDKCYLLLSGQKFKHQWVQIGKHMVWEENKIRLLAITIENELKFDSHISNICLKANKKLNVSCKLKNILTFQQQRIDVGQVKSHIPAVRYQIVPHSGRSTYFFYLYENPPVCHIY